MLWTLIIYIYIFIVHPWRIPWITSNLDFLWIIQVVRRAHSIFRGGTMAEWRPAALCPWKRELVHTDQPQIGDLNNYWEVWKIYKTHFMNRNFKQPTAISINNNWDAWHLGLRRWANFGVSFVGLKSDDQLISKKRCAVQNRSSPQG